MSTSLSRIASWFTIQRLPILGALLAAITALWMIHINNGRINNDGILYLEIARLFSEGYWSEGIALYNWPFYPALIALVHKTTQLDIHASANAITILLFSITAYALLALIRKAGGKQNEMIAALALLFSSNYLIRDILPMVIRDHGFWAFLLLGLLFLFRFYQLHKLVDVLAWGISVAVATLFRIEGLVYWILLPTILLFDTTHPPILRMKNMLRAHAVFGMATIAFLLAMALSQESLDQHLGRLYDPINFLMQSFANTTHGFHTKANLMADVVLTKFMRDYTLAGIFLTLLLALFGQTIFSIGWLHSILASVKLFAKVPVFQPAGVVPLLLGWAGIGIMISSASLLTNLVLQGRYTLSVGFVILIVAAFVLADLYRQWKTHRRDRPRIAWLFPILLGLIAIKLFITLVPHDNRKNYEMDAVAWAKSHAPADANIFYEDARLRFYAGQPFTDRESGWEHLKKNGGSLDQFDLLITKISRRQPERLDNLLKDNKFLLLKTFEDTAGNQMVILVPASKSKH